MPTDLEGKPFLFVAGNKKDYDLEKHAWVKSLEFGVILPKRKYVIPNKKKPTIYEEKYCWVYQLWHVEVEPCINCQRTKKDYCRIKVMSVKSGLFRRCFAGKYGAFKNSDVTEWYQWQKEGYAKLIEETPLESFSEVYDLFKKGKVHFIADMDLVYQLENQLGVTL
jgi:hypothetical protein